MKFSRQLKLTLFGSAKLTLLLFVCLAGSRAVYSQTTFTKTYQLGGGIEVACCAKGPMSWGFTPVIQDTSLSGNVQITSISVSDTGNIAATDPNGIAGTTWEIFAGNTSCGFPVGEEKGEISLTTYTCNAPAQLVFNTNGTFQAPTKGTFSGSYNFTTGAFTANDMGAFISGTTTPTNLTQGLFVQILLWGGDVGADLTLNNISITVTGTVTSAGATDQFATINVPGATSAFPQTINDLGQIVGYYTDSEGVNHGFLLNAGVATTIDFPDALFTVADTINNNGEISGTYEDANNLLHGFLLNDGIFTTIDDPALPGGIIGVGISDFGLIFGNGIDGEGAVHGFILNNGTFTPINFPGANLTLIADTNFNGSEIVGLYTLPSFPANVSAGFTYVNGVFESYSVPETSTTELEGITNGGQLLGNFSTSDPMSNAFLLTGTTLTIQDFPGASSTSSVNLNDLGQIVGRYIDEEGASHGYLETNGPFLYIAGSGGVAVWDTATDLTIATVPVTGAYELAVTPDQSHIYVADAGSNSVSVISTASNAVTATIPVGLGPDGVAITPDGAYAYVANNDANNPNGNTVSVISTAKNAVVNTITVGPAPYLPKVTPDGTHVYVANQNNTISVIDTATNAVSATIELSAEATGLVFTPDGAFAYVGENTNPGNVAVLAIPSNKLVTTIPLGTGTISPIKLAITPDGAFVYVTNLGSNNVSVVSTATNTTVATVPVGKIPYAVAASADGSHVYVGNVDDSTISVISTATNTVVGTVPVASGVTGIAVGGTPPTSQQITQPLSPTAPNVFNFGTNNFTVQYPPGTSFSGVNMTVNMVEITEAQFSQRVAGTAFASSSCIVYGGAGGNCVDYKVTCSNTSGTQIPCPSEATPTITVQTSFTTLQPIVNPGFLTTPIGENDWTNIFTGFSDPSIKGRTKGFSEFVAVDLGASNAQGLGTFSFLAPLQTSNPRVFTAGTQIPVAFQLASLATPGQFITDATANLTLEMVANAAGQSQSTVILALNSPFHLSNKTYSYALNTSGFAAGTYVLTIYGNAFAAEAVQFTIKGRSATTCTIQSSSPLFSTGETLTFTGVVQPTTASSVTPTGTATFYDSAYSRIVLGTATLNAAGKASIRHVLTAPPDRQWVEFTYPGDNNFLPCTSQEIPEDYSTSK